MIGKTNSQTGGSVKGEKLNISLSTNQNSHSDILGAIVTVTHPGGATQYVWEGYEITVEVPPYVNYSVEYSAVDGYATPASFSSTAIEGNARTLTAQYKTCIVTASIKSNQSSTTDLANATLTVGGKTLKNGQSAKFPLGSQVTPSWSSVTGYKSPSNTSTVSLGNASQTIEGTYQTCVLTVNIADNQSSLNDIASVKATVKGTTVNASLSSGGSVKVPFGEAVTVTGAELTGYATPSAVSYTAADASKSVTLTYNTTLVTVVMADNQTAYDDIANATATVAASGITTQTVSNGGVVKVPTGVSCTITWAAVADYSTPVAQTFTTSGSAVTKTGTYQCQVLTVNVVGSGATPSGYTITVKNSSTGATIGTQTTASKVYKIPFGVSYIIAASALTGYNAVIDQSGSADSASISITVTYVYNPVKDLSMFDIYGNPIAQSTANCYVVKEAGVYKFPLVFGNAIKNGQVNAAAYTNNGGSYSQDFVDSKHVKISSPYISSNDLSSVYLASADTDGVFTDISFADGVDCRYVQFSVDHIPETGANGIISIHEFKAEIVWNWHIWVWPYDLTPVEITNATGVKYNIMPVNLATKLDTADSINKTTGWKNWFYQWGRPTPLLCPSAYNATENHAGYGFLSYAAESKAYSYSTGLQNPTTFFYNGSSPYNWFGSKSYYNLWDAACTTTGNSDNNVVKTVYDPCPVGWKVPNGNTFTGFSKTNVVGSFSNGWKFKRYSGDTTGVFFPASGSRGRSNGSLYNVGSSGYVWLSSAYSQDNAYYLSFRSSSVYPQDDSYRAYGFSVRPVQE